MVDYHQIQRLSSKIGISEETVEKDYLIELILFYLSQNNYFQEKFIFGGGTALKKIYFPNYRFSEDLDFLVKYKENHTEIIHKLSRILAKISGDYALYLNNRSEYNQDRLQFFVLYDLIPEIRTVKELKIDILKNDFISSFQKKKILFSYQEFKAKNLFLKTYILESIVSDKISRILDVDNEPRDLYDLWYLLKLKLDITKVKEEFKKKYGYDIYVPNLLSEITKDDYKRHWQIRLAKQIPKLPSYEIVKEELEKLIKAKLNK